MRLFLLLENETFLPWMLMYVGHFGISLGMEWPWSVEKNFCSADEAVYWFFLATVF